MAGKIVCWRCGISLKDIPRPIVRHTQCKACHADLHVCRLCSFYNPRISDKCDHDLAEPAREVDVANFCHYFKPVADAYNRDEGQRSKNAMDELRSLFGDEEIETQEINDKKDDVSKKDADIKRLEDLFK